MLSLHRHVLIFLVVQLSSVVLHDARLRDASFLSSGGSNGLCSGGGLFSSFFVFPALLPPLSLRRPLGCTLLLEGIPLFSRPFHVELARCSLRAWSTNQAHWVTVLLLPRQESVAGLTRSDFLLRHHSLWKRAERTERICQ